MSDKSVPSVASNGAETGDESVQREWDRFAMPDFSDERDSHRNPLSITGRSTTNAGLEMRVYDSLPAYGSSTALGDALARATSHDLPEEDADTSNADETS